MWHSTYTAAEASHECTMGMWARASSGEVVSGPEIAFFIETQGVLKRERDMSESQRLGGAAYRANTL